MEQSSVVLHVEWLDARRAEGVHHVADFERFLLTKYSQSRLALLVAADDAAFDSLRRFRAALDPKLPLVFCGLNNVTPALLAKETDIAGVSETLDITGTVNLGLRLFPKTSHLAVVADSTGGGLANLEGLRQARPGFPRSLAVTELLDVKRDDLAGILGGLPRDTLVLVLGILQGPDGERLPLGDSMAACSTASSFPVLTCWDFEVGAGALGGLVVSGLEQGRAAGGLARRILAGEAVAGLPRIRNSPNVPMVDEIQLRRFGLDVGDLPPGVVVVNRQESLYARYRGLVWTALAVFAVMAGCIMGLALALGARKRAVVALVASEARYRTYVDSAPSAIFIADAAGRLHDVNPAACRMTGWSRDELLAQNIADVLDPDGREAIVRRFAAIGAQARTAEVLGRHRDGTARWWSIAAVQMLPDRVLGFASDVTERRQRDDARLAFYELLQNADSVVVFKDCALRYGMVNRAYLLLTGHRLDDIMGRTDAELFAGLSSPEQIAQYIANDRQALALPRGQSLTSEEGMLGENGRNRTFLTRKFPVYADDDRLLGVGTMSTEITERKEAEARFRESETRYKLLAEQAPISIMAFDAAGRIIFVNKRHLDVFAGGRKTPEFFLGRRLVELPGIVRAGIADKLKPLLSGEAVDLQAVYFPEFTGGHAGYVNLRGVPLYQDDGSFAGGILIREDVTERIEMERSLTVSRNEAEAANRAKSAFLANMSHEIRTPLNGVLGMLQLLKETPLDNEQAEYAELAIQSSRRLTRLLADILDISKVEAGKMQIQADPFDLSVALRQVLELFTPVARQAGVALVSHIADTLPAVVVGDAARVQQVLTNLIGNAFKFTTAGSVTVEAYPLPSHKAQEVRVLFCVADTGCGIPDEAIGSLFKPFTQVSQGYRRNVQGAGLGLSICSRLVTLMGGNIAVDSEPGVGTSIYFCVTFASAQALACQIARPGRRSPAVAGLRVLLAEDDHVTRLATSRMLEKAGHAVTVAFDGAQALERLAAEDFDLVLMDIQMPVMDGLEAVRAIRTAPHLAAKAAIPVIALTSYAMTGDQETFLAAGMDGYVPKPFSMDELNAVITKVLRQRPPA
ncbi:sensory box histidine kinase/response regulator [Desulfovibrio sp. TomC]|nr:sensory box histidine kinase/response regulator [Desulfovibrio sp. TomC]